MHSVPDLPVGVARTHVVELMFTRIWRAHHLRRIAIFAGPPGIGKTTAINAFVNTHEGCCALITAPSVRCGAREVLRMAYRAIAGEESTYRHPQDVKNTLYWQLSRGYCDFEYDPRIAWSSRSAEERKNLAKFTIIVDEAQYLARDAIEALRNMNDGVGSAPIALGIVFVGNDEFALFGDKRRESQISAAVADRALCQERLGYDDLSKADRMNFLASLGVQDRHAAELILQHVQREHRAGSLRRIIDTLDGIRDDAGREEISVDDVKAFFE